MGFGMGVFNVLRLKHHDKPFCWPYRVEVIRRTFGKACKSQVCRVDSEKPSPHRRRLRLDILCTDMFFEHWNPIPAPIHYSLQWSSRLDGVIKALSSYAKDGLFLIFLPLGWIHDPQVEHNHCNSDKPDLLLED